MRINGRIMLDKLIWLATVVMFFSITAFAEEDWGKFVLAGMAVLMVLLTILRNKGTVRLQLSPWHGFLFSITAYCVFTSLWSLNPSGAINTGRLLILILICYTLAYIPYQANVSVDKMLSAVKWGSYATMIYAFAYYGYDAIMEMMSEEVRLSNELVNANSLGNVAALSIVIQTFEISRTKKLKISSLFCVPSIVMVAATQSREALVLAILGVLFVLAIPIFENGISMGSLLKGLLTVTVVIVAIIGMLQLPIFAGINNRMKEFGSLFSSQSGDASIRKRLIELGWEYFLKNPIGGVGFGGPRILAKRVLGVEFYMHNNFVELLCSGGVIGFGIFYGMYLYLFYNMYKYRRFKDDQYWLCLIMMALLVIVDYAMVSVYDKASWFYFMILFLEVQRLKQRSRDYEVKEIMEGGNAVSKG